MKRVLIMVGIIAIGIIADRGMRATAPTITTVISGWRSNVPPIDTPIVAVWADEVRAVMVVKHGDVYWEYAPTLLPPYGSMLGRQQPSFWTDMPGGAK